MPNTKYLVIEEKSDKIIASILLLLLLSLGPIFILYILVNVIIIGIHDSDIDFLIILIILIMSVFTIFVLCGLFIILGYIIKSTYKLFNRRKITLSSDFIFLNYCNKKIPWNNIKSISYSNFISKAQSSISFLLPLISIINISLSLRTQNFLSKSNNLQQYSAIQIKTHDNKKYIIDIDPQNTNYGEYGIVRLMEEYKNGIIISSDRKEKNSSLMVLLTILGIFIISLIITAIIMLYIAWKYNMLDWVIGR